ncbi:MAG: chromosome segregation protein [Blastopirellula sp.]|nr:chromosome segregation protein [Blastopirellula sp.]
MKRWRNYLVIFGSVLFMAGSGVAQEIDFDRDIRPILSDNCSQCHGPDEATREADLRLDVKDSAFADRGNGPAFRAGKVAESEALRRIFSADPDEQMPPPDSKLRLSTEQKEKLRKWVAQGADWSDHWAFVAPRVTEPPVVEDDRWSRNGIDRFVVRRLAAEGWGPSSAASRRKLIRRVTLDLTGIAPTPQEVAAFVEDTSDQAYEKVVDRLLKSPRYGERMAWEWLDAARYADTDGFQGDPTRTMWPWRDWLIHALNDNMPFDQFTTELLAGDLLPNATPEQVLATGFNRNHMHNGEGGRIAEETRVENVFDRTETTATVWLGLTMTCCRCHDHKFDPITQKEYFQLYAFFNNTSESGQRGGGKAAPTIAYRSRAQRSELSEIQSALAELTKQRDAADPVADKAQRDWERRQATLLRKDAAQLADLKLPDWQVLGTLPAPNGDGAKAFQMDFGPEKQVDLKARYGTPQLAWRTEPKFRDGQVNALPETVGATYLFRVIEAPTARTLQLSLGSDDGIKVWLNQKQLLAKQVDRGAAADQERVALELQTGRNELLIKIVNTGGIGGFYFQVTGSTINGLTPEIVKLLLLEKRSQEQQRTLQRFYRERYSDKWKQHQQRIATLEKRQAELSKTGVTVMVMDRLPESKTRQTKILVKGLYNKATDQVVKANTPAFLPPLPASATRDRLTLARWLVDPANPLTARVTVNRYWQLFFGQGLVKSTEDFGSQGQRPTHPELLDWLARYYVASGWDTKGLHKLIVMSATYRQASTVTAESLARDPSNALLGRMTRFRLPSWMLRDQALAMSGLLVDQVGGPPVRPYQPPGIWAEATFNRIRYQQDGGQNLYRRSLYTFWRRIVGPTMFFDGGKRQTCEVKPTRTNTPLHALTTLNDVTFVEAARAMAQRTLSQDRLSDEQRLAWAFELATSREPEPQEAAILGRRLTALKAQFAADPEAATKLLQVGESTSDENLDRGHQAAFTVICSMLLNLDETLSHD